MTRRSRIVRRIAPWALVLAVLATAVWLGVARLRRDPDPVSPPQPVAHRANGPSPDANPGPAPRAAALPFTAHRPGGNVTITGRVIDVRQQRPVAGVEVVFRGDTGDTGTTTRSDGSYSLQVVTGTYHAFVRSDDVLSVGRRDLPRLPWQPSAEAAGVPDEALLSAVRATHDTSGVDLPVVRGGVIAGRVVDGDGKPVAGAVLHAQGGTVRPTLSTDIAASDADGRFELRLPPGAFELAATHPSFAGIASADRTRYVVEPGDRVAATVMLAIGCVISGRVLDPDGEHGRDGAIERQWGTGELEFEPVGAIGPDGTFLWATTDEADVTLRAWPWKSPPSQTHRFACRDGARFSDVVFRVPERRADVDGVLVDRAGQPLGFAFIDMKPLDPGGVGQQERTDGTGHWAIYSVPPGRYRFIAQGEGRGIASTVIAAPRNAVRLELSGTGRLEGTTPRLARGSFELVLDSCVDSGEVIRLPQSPRMVTVVGGRFTVDDLPACELSFTAIWRGRSSAQHIAIPAGGAARLELDLGEPQDKTVHGVVRDAAGQPVAGAVVSVVRSADDAGPGALVRTDAGGGYTLKAFSGASLRAAAHGKLGHGTVGGANVDREQVDLVVDEPGDDTATGH